jgi:anti-anti-sigma regulatory factor
MAEDTCPVRWIDRQAVVTLPEHIDRSDADRVREQLLLVINRGAVVLIADLAVTVSCDYSGADALARAYRRAAASGTELRIVVTADVSAACSASPGSIAWSRSIPPWKQPSPPEPSAGRSPASQQIP